MQFLTAKEVAALLRVGRSTVYGLMSQHGLPRPLSIGGKRLWREDEVLAWRQARDEAR